MALGVRRQRLMAFPEQNLIAVFPERIGDRVPSARTRMKMIDLLK